MLCKWLYPSLYQIYIHSVVQIFGVQNIQHIKQIQAPYVNIYSFFLSILGKKNPKQQITGQISSPSSEY